MLRYDYEPVFRPALDVLEALAAADAHGGVNQAVRAVAAWAKENAEVYVSMGMEYAGELFSRVLGNQASDGAFFTRQSAARLLAELALDATGETAWTDRRTWRRLKMADLACGSGTLLNAYLEAVKNRIRKARRRRTERGRVPQVRCRATRDGPGYQSSLLADGGGTHDTR